LLLLALLSAALPRPPPSPTGPSSGSFVNTTNNTLNNAPVETNAPPTYNPYARSSSGGDATTNPLDAMASKKKLPIGLIIGVLVVILAIIGVLVYIFFFRMKENPVQ
jgi:hypothetical protein